MLPPDNYTLTGASQWHDIDLNVRTWLDDCTDTFRYVNEIPRGALQKFELQTGMVGNVIREDSRGSRKLKAFGQPVPFNYGCFPRTFRDPEEFDEIYGAPGDRDPTDAIDLTAASAGVGEVVCCRPLGAVCLIDEGQADWKIFVVNTESKDPLAAAQTIKDAERIAPGRIEEALKWMDDFKQFSSKTGATLHYEIHDAARARSIIAKDHAAWKRLVADADDSGFSHGHWIRSAQPAKVQAEVLPIGWASPLAVPSWAAHGPNTLAGTSHPARNQPVYVPGRELTLRRQTSSNSDGADSSSSGMSMDSDLGA